MVTFGNLGGGGSDRVEWLGDEGVGELENETLGSKDGWGWIRRPELVDIVNEICVIYLLMSDGIVAGCLCHRTAKIRDILSSELLASSFRPMILNANGSGFCPPGDDLIRLTEIGGKFSFLRGVVHVPDENVDGRIFDIYHQLCFSQSVMTQI